MSLAILPEPRTENRVSSGSTNNQEPGVHCTNCDPIEHAVQRADIVSVNHRVAALLFTAFSIAWTETAEFARAYELLAAHRLTSGLSIPGFLGAAMALRRSAILYSRRPGPQPECSDSELLTLAIVSECREWHKETNLIDEWQGYRLSAA